MKTILVVEDDKNQLLLYKNELASEGYNIITAIDGCEAVKMAKDCSPDLIIMDIQMPRMDGIESMGKILGARRNVPIIINTAYSNYKDKFVSWSADAYVVKSSDLNELKKKIKELIH